MELPSPKFPADFAVLMAKTCELLSDDFDYTYGNSSLDIPAGTVYLKSLQQGANYDYKNKVQLHEFLLERAEPEVVEMVAQQQNTINEVQEQHDTLQAFQKMCAIVPYEKAVMVYHGIELSEPQVEFLRLICELTPSWIKGEVTERLLSILESGTDQKAAAGIAEALLEAMETGGANLGKDAKGNKRKGGSVIKSFYMKLNTEDQIAEAGEQNDT